VEGDDLGDAHGPTIPGPDLGEVEQLGHFQDLERHREQTATRIAFILVISFVSLIAGNIAYILWFEQSSCSAAMETLNLVGHIFGPLIGVILAFYFALDVRLRGR
jgi:hypothetical protein